MEMKKSHYYLRKSPAVHLIVLFILTSTLTLGASGGAPFGSAVGLQSTETLDPPERFAAPETPGDEAENVRFINHQGGETGPVVVQGSYAYAVFGPELAVLDIADPLEPVRVGYIVLSPSITELFVYEHIVMAATHQVLFIVDASTPSAPTLLSKLTYNGYASALAASSTHLFLSESDSIHYPGGIHIFDYTDPVHPVQVGYYKPPGEAGGMFIDGDYLYIAEVGDHNPIPRFWGGLRIMDISTPSAPVELSFTITARLAVDVVVIDDLAYVVDVFSGLWIMDVSDPSSPVVLSQYSPGGSSGDLSIMDGIAYLANQDLGLLVVDVRDPELPQYLGTYTGAYEWIRGSFIDSIPGYILMGGGLPALDIIDISNLSEPKLAQRYGGPGWPYDMVVFGDELYVADWGTGLWVFDIANPADLAISGVYEAWSANVVTVFNDYAYLFDGNLRVLDVSNPDNIQEIGNWETNFPVGDIAANDQYVYLATEPGYPYTPEGLYVADVSDPASPSFAGGYLISGTVAVAVTDEYTFVTGWSGLYIFDTSNPANILQVGYYQQGGNDIEVVGDTIYQAAAYCDEIGCYSGLQVLDISDPSQPTEVSFSPIDSFAHQIALSGPYVYLTGSAFGKEDGTYTPEELHIFDIRDRTAPLRTGYRVISGIKMTVHDGYTYIGGYGLTVFQYGYTASGYIRDLHGAPVAGVDVSAGESFNTVTSSEGGYFVPELPPGAHTLEPSRPGYAFYPASRLVQTPPDAFGANFTLLPAPVSASLSPQAAAQLVYTDTQGLPTTFDIPPGGVALTSTLTVTPTLAYGAGGNAFAGHAFELGLSPGTNIEQGIGFDAPISVTIQYSPLDAAVVSDIERLGLYWWGGNAWISAGETCQPGVVTDHDPLSRRFAVGICSAGRYALFGPTNAVYLPYAGREP